MHKISSLSPAAVHQRMMSIYTQFQCVARHKEQETSNVCSRAIYWTCRILQRGPLRLEGTQIQTQGIYISHTITPPFHSPPHLSLHPPQISPWTSFESIKHVFILSLLDMDWRWCRYQDHLLWSVWVWSPHSPSWMGSHKVCSISFSSLVSSSVSSSNIYYFYFLPLYILYYPLSFSNCMYSYPTVVGHEIVGTALRVGKNVKHIKVGDRVGVGAQCGSCHSCSSCLAHKEHYCDKTGMFSFHPSRPPHLPF